jgi:hypothetical protein
MKPYKYILRMAIFALLVCLPSMAGENRWSTSGPYGGRFRSFYVHPVNGNWWVAAEDGFYLTKDGGRNWKRVH